MSHLVRTMKKKKKTLVKPKRHVPAPAYDFYEVFYYLEKLHKKNFRDYDGRFHGNEDAEYKDFWHYLLSRCDIQNNSYMIMPERLGNESAWVSEILEYFEDFLGADYLRPMWVSW